MNKINPADAATLPPEYHDTLVDIKTDVGPKRVVLYRVQDQLIFSGLCAAKFVVPLGDAISWTPLPAADEQESGESVEGWVNTMRVRNYREGIAFLLNITKKPPVTGNAHRVRITPLPTRPSTQETHHE